MSDAERVALVTIAALVLIVSVIQRGPDTRTYTLRSPDGNIVATIEGRGVSVDAAYGYRLSRPVDGETMEVKVDD